MHEQSFIINRNTLLHVSTLLGHLQGEPSVIVTLCTLQLSENVLLTVYWRRELSAVRPAGRTAESNGNLSVTVTKSSP
jgi:hypothetical protein